MHRLSLFIGLVLMFGNVELSANRSMYVDGFEEILGDIDAEDALLSYAQSHGIETLLLYGLHIVHANYDLPNPATNYVLADFIYKAKSSYGVLYVGATAENGSFFTNIIDAYNNSRSDPLEKFDIYNLEFEYWINTATGPGGYYCTTYLTPNGLACTVDGAFQFYVTILQTMKALAANNSHPITTEAYIGWPTAAEAETIGANLDRLRLHAYVSDPNTAFDYSAGRLMDLANGNPGLELSIIFSSEPDFMQNWLENNSMIAAENIYTTDWINGSSGWGNNVDLTGFTYFTYTHLVNVVLPVELSYFKGKVVDGGIQLSWETLSETHSDYFEVERQSTLSPEFEFMGYIKAAENSTSAISYHFLDANPHPGVNYYRLKQVDYDGEFTYSDLLPVSYQQENGTTEIYPSLAKDLLFIRSTATIDHGFIYDANGRKIKVINGVDATLAEININDLVSGIYVLILKAGLNYESFRFVKQN